MRCLVKLKLCIALSLISPLIARAEIGEHPYPAVVYKHEEITSPVPQKFFVAIIDLTNPDVKVRVSRGGPDPDGDGKWETTLMPPTKVADREGFDVVINGDFFSHLSGKDAEGAAALKEFQGGTPATVHGPAVTDGQLWASPDKPRATFMIDAQKHVTIAQTKTPPTSVTEAIAGSDIIVKDGKNVARPPEPKGGFAKGPHPRTAVGVADHGKTLVLVVIDGRKKDEAIGMSLQEVAEVMLKYNCEDAVNLDGGGSSVLAIRDPKTHKMDILNKPSDGRERSVGNVLGVSVTPKKRDQAAKPE
jgi:exopolysaccharide biosynthesis protein